MPCLGGRSARALGLALSALASGCSSESAPLDADDVTGVGGSSSAAPGVGGGSRASGAGGAGGEAVPPINEGFIGGPCAVDADCEYAGGFCLTDADGFPEGMCSLDCDLYCPDQDGAVASFCISPADLGAPAAAGLCSTRCAFGQSSTGCRDGYQCHPLSRYEDPDTVAYTCVPGEDAPFPLSACHQELIDKGIAFTPAVSPLESPEGLPDVVCDIEDPVLLDPTLQGIAYRPSSADAAPEPLFVSCPFALSLDGLSAVLAERGASDLIHFGTYNCRVIAGTTQLSEHGLARAIDIAGVRLASGDIYTVLGDWELDMPSPATEAGAFLKDLAVTLHDEHIFNIILTPDYNADHHDHLHCDITPGADYLE